MAFNQPDIVPAAAEVIFRVLEATPGKRLRAESLVQRVVPDASNAGLKVTRETLRELRSIGAVVEHDDQIQVRADLAGQAPSMREIVRCSVMEQSSDPDLWTVPDDEADGPALTGASDLLRALSWLLVQQNSGVAWSFDGPASLQQDQADRLPFALVRNDTRWTPFVRWATYLGFASRIADSALIPDPTRAVAPFLERELSGRGPQRLEELIDRLRTEFPVLDAGFAQRGLTEIYNVSWDADVSPALTLAFTRLRQRGVLEFDEGLGDAEKVRFANEQGAYHAVRWVKAA